MVILQRIQKDLQDQNMEPEKFGDQMIFMSMSNDIEWTKTGNSELCISDSEQVKKYAKRFSRGHWNVQGPGDEEKWYGTLSFSPEGKRDFTATQMVKRFEESGHRLFKSIRALSRGILKRKNNRDTIHFNAGARWCEEFGQRPNERERADFGKVRDKRK